MGWGDPEDQLSRCANMRAWPNCESSVQTGVPSLKAVSVFTQDLARRGATRVGPALWTTLAANWAPICSRYRQAALWLPGSQMRALGDPAPTGSLANLSALNTFSALQPRVRGIMSVLMSVQAERAAKVISTYWLWT